MLSGGAANHLTYFEIMTRLRNATPVTEPVAYHTVRLGHDN